MIRILLALSLTFVMTIQSKELNNEVVWKVKRSCLYKTVASNYKKTIERKMADCTIESLISEKIQPIKEKIENMGYEIDDEIQSGVKNDIAFFSSANKTYHYYEVFLKFRGPKELDSSIKDILEIRVK